MKNQSNKSEDNINIYDLVRSDDIKIVAKYLKKLKLEDRASDSPSRFFPHRKTYAANAIGSEFYLHRNMYKVDWKTLEDGTMLGIVSKLESDK